MLCFLKPLIEDNSILKIGTCKTFDNKCEAIRLSHLAYEFDNSFGVDILKIFLKSLN